MTSSNISAKILCIEDEDRISSALKTALEARNYNVTIINEGLRALKFLEIQKKDAFQLVLLDLMLPGANGWEILVKIRALPNTSNWPVIMLTAVDDEISESRALYDGADDFITKPFSMKVLLARIEANLRKKQSESSLDFELHFSDGNFDDLTPREKEILGYVAKGYNNKEISQKIFISETTVGNHLSNVFNKLNVTSRTQAAIIALKYSSLLK
ncbi:MAG: response regulator transcription factor [Cyanobacteriota bacterium]